MKTLHETDKLLKGVKRVHMIGIGGSGMYPLAEILHDKGFTVSGSDNLVNEATARLSSMGLKVYKGQSGQNVAGAELVVYSAAVLSISILLSYYLIVGVNDMFALVKDETDIFISVLTNLVNHMDEL